MEALIIAIKVVQIISLSLGVGGSTLAIASFFVAIYNGTISTEERQMLGVIYIVLRVAMVLLLVTALLLLIIATQQNSTPIFTTNLIAYWVLLFVLYINATLMTMHYMPSTFGPAIQASAWYGLGIISALSLLGVIFTLTHFIICYIAFLVFTIGLVNGIMYILNERIKGVAITSFQSEVAAKV
jgi:hypothetical protein